MCQVIGAPTRTEPIRPQLSSAPRRWELASSAGKRATGQTRMRLRAPWFGLTWSGSEVDGDQGQGGRVGIGHRYRVGTRSHKQDDLFTGTGVLLRLRHRLPNNITKQERLLRP
ncbi:hypothetical protein GCM10009603_39470 [Nocardiopsis exhalans]